MSVPPVLIKKLKKVSSKLSLLLGINLPPSVVLENIQDLVFGISVIVFHWTVSGIVII